MRSRSTFIAGLVALTILIGLWIVIDSLFQNTVPGSPSIKDGFNLPPTVRNPSDLLDYIFASFVYIFRILLADKELLFYGAIAIFAILIMVLAINSAAPRDRNKTDTMLELLKQEKERAENLAKLKSEFLNQVSHELRTPLAVIIGYIECMTDGLYGRVEPKHQEILEVVAKQSSHLKNMIDQILIFSRLESSRQPLRVEEFSVHTLLADSRDTFDFLCKQKGLELKWDIARDVPPLRNDAERFKEIVSNLIQNAVKYTDQGSISVTVRSLPATDSVALEVADTGIGIPEYYLSSIFEPFIQAHKTSSENSRGGIGLGLSIVKKHIEQLKGTITVESEVGTGSVFRVILPRVFQERRAGGNRLLRLVKLPFARPKTTASKWPWQANGRAKRPDRASGAAL